MNITMLPLGQMQANCYIVTEGESCAVIDPGAQAEKLVTFLREKGLTPDAVFLTHGHFDHVGACRALAQTFSVPVYLHEADTSMTGRLAHGLYWDRTYAEGDTVRAGDLSFLVLHTPGHTPGSVCLQAENVLFTGDTLFAGSCGRTDFPGGSWEEMLASLGRLAALEGTYTVLSGHGGETTLARERQYNPYMKEATNP